MKVRAITTLLNVLHAWVVISGSGILQQQLWGLPSGLAYYVQVNIGSPLYSSSSGSSSANAFNLLLDTGSANTAVVTAACCSLTNENLYSCAASSTCVDLGTSVNVTYVSGSWSGQLVQDVFSGQGLGTIENMPFAEITAENDFLSPGYGGIIGLAYQVIASPVSDPLTPYFDNVQGTNELNNMFSLQMCGALQSLALNNLSVEEISYLHAGELLLGGAEGPNGEHYHREEIVYTPLVQEQYYNVVVTDIGVSGQSLGLDCERINSPRAIIDSGSSNLVFPSSVYSAVIAGLKTQVEEVTSGITDVFTLSDESACCSSECDPTNVDSIIFSLPGLTISLAVDDKKSQQMTVTIPATYIWRPLVISTSQGNLACRVFSISEGDFTLLGNVFMDGLFTVHDRENKRVGLALADNCPNGVTSSKNISMQTMDAEFCHCVGSSDRKGSLLSSYMPFSSKPCYFWQWWMYVIIVTLVIIVLMGVTYCCLWWKRRKLKGQLEDLQSQHQPNAQRNMYPNGHYDLAPMHQSFILPTATALVNNGIPDNSGYRLALSPSVRFDQNTMEASAAAAAAVPAERH